MIKTNYMGRRIIDKYRLVLTDYVEGDSNG